MFTELGKNTMQQAKEIGLAKWYDAYAGNFMFSEEDYFAQIKKVNEWLKAHPDYFVLKEDITPYADNILLENTKGKVVYFLTNWTN